tara:strand:- start:1977 stop:2882 length:906 start_codon:yes stop_codon:yes gene_type:complete
MLTFPTKNLFVEGPDCSGKTTLVKSIHERTGYRWHIHDRSQISRFIFANMYSRNIPNIKSDLDLEMSNLNNRFIFLLPDPDVIIKRFKSRGDEIHDIDSIMDVWSRFAEASDTFYRYPNVIGIGESESEKIVDRSVMLLHMMERPQLLEISNTVKSFVKNTKSKESYPLQFTLFDDGKFEEASSDSMDYDSESEYYEEIYEKFHNKIKRELSGKNEYSRKESISSRRFVYTDDRCISFIQCAIREGMMDFNFVLRSSDVENTFEHDLKFLYYLASTCYDLFSNSCNSIRMRFNLNSAHFVQ